MDCCVFPVFMALLRYFSLPGWNSGAHRFCSLKVLFCCGPGEPHGSALFVQTLEWFVLSVTGESRGFLFFCSPRGGGGQAPRPFCVVLAEGSGIALGLDAESGSSWIPAWNYLSCSAHWMGRGLGSQGEPPVLPLVPEQPLVK